MLRRKKFQVIYPEYFEASLSRSEGRKVSKKLSCEDSSLRKVVFACKKLELDYTIQQDKAYPSQWWLSRGRLLISIDKQNKVPKSKLINKIAGITSRIKQKEKVIYKVRETPKKVQRSKSKVDTKKLLEKQQKRKNKRGNKR